MFIDNLWLCARLHGLATNHSGSPYKPDTMGCPQGLFVGTNYYRAVL